MKARPPEPRADPGIRIRPMRIEDLPSVVAIERASFTIPWAERTFRGLLERPNSVLLVAEHEPAEGGSTPAESGAAPAPAGPGPTAGTGGPGLVGYAVVWIAGREAELGDLAVRAEARRRGVGRALLEAVLAAAAGREVNEVFLEVRESNDSARRLYERVGFSVVGSRPAYYSRPIEDAVVMRRSLGVARAGA